MRMYVVVAYLVLFLAGCEQPEQTLSADIKPSTTLAAEPDTSLQIIDSVPATLDLSLFKEVEWIDLIPESDLNALMNPPDYLMQIEDGSFEDQITSQIQHAIDSTQDEASPYQQALMSTNIITAMDNQNIKIPGFVVPVEFNEEQAITSFFLVPFFGACLHMPPPPPNQIIYVETEKAFRIASLFDPVLITGKLSAELFEDQIATSAYTMQMNSLTLYEDSE